MAVVIAGIGLAVRGSYPVYSPATGKVQEVVSYGQDKDITIAGVRTGYLQRLTVGLDDQVVAGDVIGYTQDASIVVVQAVGGKGSASGVCPHCGKFQTKEK